MKLLLVLAILTATPKQPPPRPKPSPPPAPQCRPDAECPPGMLFCGYRSAPGANPGLIAICEPDMRR